MLYWNGISCRDLMRYWAKDTLIVCQYIYMRWYGCAPALQPLYWIYGYTNSLIVLGIGVMSYFYIFSTHRSSYIVYKCIESNRIIRFGNGFGKCWDAIPVNWVIRLTQDIHAMHWQTRNWRTGERFSNQVSTVTDAQHRPNRI